MNFERFAKSYFGGDFAVAITDPLAMVLEKFREFRFGYAVMRCLEQLPNFFAASESSGIIAPRLMAKKIRFSGFLPCFRGFAQFHKVTVKNGSKFFFAMPIYL